MIKLEGTLKAFNDSLFYLLQKRGLFLEVKLLQFLVDSCHNIKKCEMNKTFLIVIFVAEMEFN